MSERAAILMYHILDASYSEREAKYCLLPERFAEQMAWISDNCNPITLDQLLAAQEGKARLPDNAVAVTFDDGFATTFEHAMPVLEKYCVPATMYIVANRIGGDNDWMHSRGMPKRTLMDASQIREMDAAGIDIGSHTLNHARLSETPEDQMQQEIAESKTCLEGLLTKSVRHFAYPYGLYNETARNLVEQAGYVSACSTRSGFNNATTDCYLLRRIEVFGSDKLWHFKQKLKFGTNDAAWYLPLQYYSNRLFSRLSVRG